MTIHLTVSVPGLLSFLFVSAHLHNCEQETGEREEVKKEGNRGGDRKTKEKPGKGTEGKKGTNRKEKMETGPEREPRNKKGGKEQQIQKTEWVWSRRDVDYTGEAASEVRKEEE